MAAIYNETPSGTIDGVNTVFTTASSIGSLIYVAIDGQVFTGAITIGVTSITLETAPTVSIRITYVPAGSTPLFGGSLTVSAMWNDILARVSNIGDISETDRIRAAGIVNENIYDAIVEADPERLMITLPAVNIVAPTSIAIQSDLETMEAEGAGFYFVNTDGTDTSTVLPLTGFGSKFSGYYIDATNFQFTGTINGSYKQRYIPNNTEITAITDAFIVPNGVKYREMVRAGLLAQYYFLKGDFKDSDYQNWSIEYRSLLEDFISTVRRKSGVTILEEYSSTYG